MVDGIQIIASHNTRPTARGKIVGHRGNIKFANGKTLTFEFDDDDKIIYFEGRKSGKTWTKKKNFGVIYQEKITEQIDKKKKANLFSFTDLIPEKYRSKSVKTRNIQLDPQNSSQTTVSKTLQKLIEVVNEIPDPDLAGNGIASIGAMNARNVTNEMVIH